MIARIIDCLDILLNKDVIKEQSDEDKQYEDVLTEKNRICNELELLTLSRDRYLRNCKKKTAESKTLKKENNELKEENNELKEQIKKLEKEIKNGKKEHDKTKF